MNLYLDIETLPTNRADIRAVIAGGVKPPGNISKAETIEKWNQEQRQAAIEDAVAATSFDGAYGRVCVIGWAFDDEEPQSVYSEDDEEGLLANFARRLNVDPSDRHTVCVIGHNVSSFDLRFLTQRFIVNRIRPPAVIVRAANARAWDSDKVFDTMTQWHPDRDKRASLDKLCLALGIVSPKGEIDGSKVAAFVEAGRIAEVAKYCEKDVCAVREVYKRMTFSAVEPIGRPYKEAKVEAPEPPSAPAVPIDPETINF